MHVLEYILYIVELIN